MFIFFGPYEVSANGPCRFPVDVNAAFFYFNGVFADNPQICNMQTYLVLVAGGSGTRMGADKPKQFLELQGRPLIAHSLQAFLDAYADIHPIIVLPEAWLDQGREVLEAFFPGRSLQFVAGGETRFHSVQQGLSVIPVDGVVFVHDAVRCLVTVSLIRRCYESVLQTGSAIPAVPVRDSLRVLTASGSQPINRDLVRAVQTPQAFRVDLLRAAFTQAYRPTFTDEATVLEASGHPVTLVEGEETNIKVTYPVDLVLAERLLGELDIR
jgi:2-C-methyl-D-erythritol 4-phosphate cytidylyltransferase